MKVILLLGAFFAGTSVLAAPVTPGNEKLIATVKSPSPLQIVDGVTKSCENIKDNEDYDNVSSYYIEIPGIRLEWPSANEDFVLESIQLTLKSSEFYDGEFSCEISGSELEAMGGSGWTEFGPNSVHENDCPLKCGSIYYNSVPTSGVSLKGTVEFVGKTNDVHGKERERKTKVNIKVLNPK